MVYAQVPSFLLAFAALFDAAFAAPTTAVTGTRDVKEVIPGPGFPSLASSNLTSADLYAMPLFERQDNLLAVRAPSGCETDPSLLANVNDIAALYSYLNSLGTTQCGVPPQGGVEFMIGVVVRSIHLPVVPLFSTSNAYDLLQCRTGTAHILGSTTNPGGTTSYCRDVASAVLSIIQSRTIGNQCAGYTGAGGNGDLLVGAEHN